MEDIMKRIVARYASKSVFKMMSFETDEERDAYTEGTEDVMEMLNAISEKVEDEKEKSFHNPAFDDLINAFIFLSEEE